MREPLITCTCSIGQFVWQQIADYILLVEWGGSVGLGRVVQRTWNKVRKSFCAWVAGFPIHHHQILGQYATSSFQNWAWPIVISGLRSRTHNHRYCNTISFEENTVILLRCAQKCLNNTHFALHQLTITQWGGRARGIMHHQSNEMRLRTALKRRSGVLYLGNINISYYIIAYIIMALDTRSQRQIPLFVGARPTRHCRGRKVRSFSLFQVSEKRKRMLACS